MAILTSLFDILRGWPREGALDESFPIKDSETVIAGEVVQYDAGGANPGAITAATTADRASANAKAVFVVIEGNDDFSSQFVGKAVVLRSNAVFQLDPANFVDNAGLVPGAPVTCGSQSDSSKAGMWLLAVTNDQIIGYVEQNNVAVNGTIVVRFENTGEIKL